MAATHAELRELIHKLRNELSPVRSGVDLLHAAGGNDLAIRERAIEILATHLEKAIGTLDELSNAVRLDATEKPRA